MEFQRILFLVLCILDLFMDDIFFHSKEIVFCKIYFKRLSWQYSKATKHLPADFGSPELWFKTKKMLFSCPWIWKNVCKSIFAKSGY